jgi:hypothetical protein
MKNKSSPWSNKLLQLVLFLLLLETLSGLAIFFLVPLRITVELYEFLHIWFGFALIPVYIIFQVYHYKQKLKSKGSLAYSLGLATAFSLILTILTGLSLYFNLISIENLNNLPNLIHAITSFIWMMLFASHLAVVLK